MENAHAYELDEMSKNGRSSLLLERKYIFLALFSLSILASITTFSVPNTFAETTYTVTQITDNNFVDDNPQIHNGQITWMGYSIPCEIFLYNGSSIIQLTNNTYDERMPQIHNGQITWHGLIESDYEIFIYNGSTVTRITNNSYHDGRPYIHDGWVTWPGNDEIFLYNISSKTTIQVTDGYSDMNPRIHNGWVTWTRHDGYDNEICLYEILTDTITQITDNSYEDYSSQIHDGHVTWLRRTEVPFADIFLYDGSNITQIATNVTDDCNLRIHSGQVTWCASDGHDIEIYLYDIQSGITIQITDNDYADVFPEIHSGQVTWRGDYDIFVYDFSTNTTTQITDDSMVCTDQKCQIHNGQITWQRFENSDGEIFLAAHAPTYTLTVHVQSRLRRMPLEGVNTMIYRDSTLVDSAYTDENGDAVFQLEEDTYTIIAERYLFMNFFRTKEEVITLTNDTTVTINFLI